MKKAIIFDMDGTLWDTTELIYKVWNETLKRHEETGDIHVSLEKIRSYMGKTMYEIGEAMLPGLSEEKAAEIFGECTDDEDLALAEEGGVLYPGLEETLRRLKDRYPLYIVSNGQKNYASAFIEMYGLGELIEDEETFGRTGLSKGENISLIMERNGIDEAVYIGDTQQDESSARFAGTKFIYAAYGFGKADAPDAVINSLSELPDCLAKMGF